MFLNFFVQVLTVNGGAVKRGDVHFDNGIIHIVDKVLMPEPNDDSVAAEPLSAT